MNKQTVIPDKTNKLINSLVKYLGDTDRAYEITKIKIDTGKGNIKNDNNK